MKLSKIQVIIVFKPKTINYEVPPRIYQLKNMNNALRGSVKYKAAEIKTSLRTRQQRNFDSQLNEVQGFTKKNILLEHIYETKAKEFNNSQYVFHFILHMYRRINRKW